MNKRKSLLLAENLRKSLHSATTLREISEQVLQWEENLATLVWTTVLEFLHSHGATKAPGNGFVLRGTTYHDEIGMSERVLQYSIIPSIAATSGRSIDFVTYGLEFPHFGHISTVHCLVPRALQDIGEKIPAIAKQVFCDHYAFARRHLIQVASSRPRELLHRTEDLITQVFLGAAGDRIGDVRTSFTVSVTDLRRGHFGYFVSPLRLDQITESLMRVPQHPRYSPFYLSLAFLSDLPPDSLVEQTILDLARTGIVDLSILEIKGQFTEYTTFYEADAQVHNGNTLSVTELARLRKPALSIQLNFDSAISDLVKETITDDVREQVHELWQEDISSVQGLVAELCGEVVRRSSSRIAGDWASRLRSFVYLA